MGTIYNHHSAEDNAYSAVLGMLIRNELPPGSSVTEVQVAEKLGISRTPARSALKRLVADRLLDSSPNKGCTVPILSRGDLNDLFEFRFLVEPIRARAAAKRYDPQKHEERIEQLLDMEAASFDSEPEYQHIVDERIHTLVNEIAGNDYFIAPIQRVTWRCQLYVYFFGSFFDDPGDIEKRSAAKTASIGEHKKLFAAIMKHDGDAAEAVMLEHVKTSYARLTNNTWKYEP